jgi:hypothetical protein
LGSIKCTWQFQKAAVSVRSLQSMTDQPAGTLILSPDPTAVILPLRIRTVPFSMGAAVGDG